MKLKQRVTMTAVLFLGMGTLFFLGVLFSSGLEDHAEDKVGKDTQTVKLPDIPRVPDSLLNERVNNPENLDRQAVADSLEARYNRSKNMIAHKRLNHLDEDDERLQESNRRLQQKLELHKSTDELDQQPRGPELLNILAQKYSDRLEKNFELPPQIVDTQLDNQPIIEGAARSDADFRDPWKIWRSWVKQDHFYPENAFLSEEMNSVMHAMATYPVTLFDVGHRGTQLKASMILKDGQRTAFKPMRQGSSITGNILTTMFDSFKPLYI